MGHVGEARANLHHSLKVFLAKCSQTDRSLGRVQSAGLIRGSKQDLGLRPTRTLARSILSVLVEELDGVQELWQEAPAEKRDKILGSIEQLLSAETKKHKKSRKPRHAKSNMPQEASSRSTLERVRKGTLREKKPPVARPSFERHEDIDANISPEEDGKWRSVCPTHLTNSS